MGLDSRALAGVQIAAVGAATAARLADHGVRADLTPAEAMGEALAQELTARGVAAQRVLLLRGDLASETLVDALQAHGAACDDLPIYRTVRPASLPQRFLNAFDRGDVDWTTLTSPSSFVNLLEL